MLQATMRETLLSYSFRLEAVKVELEGERQTLLVWHRWVLSMIVDAKPLASLVSVSGWFYQPSNQNSQNIRIPSPTAQSFQTWTFRTTPSGLWMLSPTDIRLHISTFCLLRPKDLHTIIREQVITVKQWRNKTAMQLSHHRPIRLIMIVLMDKETK